MITATNTEIQKEKTQKTVFKPARFKRSYDIRLIYLKNSLSFLRHLFSFVFLNEQNELLFFFLRISAVGEAIDL